MTKKQILLKKGDGSIERLKQKNSPGGVSKFYYIRYYVDGRQVRENSKTENWQRAYDLLMQRRHDASRGHQPASEIARIRYEDLRDALIDDYRLRNVGSLYKRGDDVTFRGKDHFNKFFKNMMASQITPDSIRKYIKWRRDQGDADPTIRRQLIHLRAAFRLAAKEGKLLSIPFFPMPQDSQPAGQYVDPDLFLAIKEAHPATLRPFLTFLYYTGCRIGAAKRITWDMVNKEATEMKLPGEIVKSRTPLVIVLAGKGLESVSSMLNKLPRSNGGRVFDITNYRGAWTKACKAKKTTVRIHDLRCSAAINLIDAGVAEDVVMKVGGWKTKSMFSRYNVMNTDRIRSAMIKAGDYVATKLSP